MKVFDLHADLAIAIGAGSEKSVLKDSWHERFRQGEVVYTSAASFFRGDESWEDMQETVLRVKKDIENSGAERILSREDLKDDQKDIIYLMTIEGMCGIKDDPEEKIQWLYDQGNRIGSLEWNDENALATGNWGDPARGLTELGRRAVRKMNELHMIIDVSHANEKTFWDLLDASEIPVIATHSNCKKCCFVERNLTDQQIRALAAKGGIIGMNACAAFIHEEKDQRTAENLARHARYIADLAGVSHVACGFDFGAYYKDEEDDYDIFAPEQTQNFIHGLRKYGFSEEEIEMIAYKNALQFLRKYML